MMPAFAVAAENRQSGIRLLSVADAARPGGAREVPPAQPVLALFLRGCKQPNLSSVDFGCKIRCLLRSGQARGWLLAMEGVQTPPQTTHSVIIMWSYHNFVRPLGSSLNFFTFLFAILLSYITFARKPLLACLKQKNISILLNTQHLCERHR